jgi:predicted O-methyltransferase YrrM
MSSAQRIRRPESSWDDVITFAFQFAHGFLRPLQVRSEIGSALPEIESLKPRVVLEIGTAGGGTFFMLSRSAHPEAHLISVDLPSGRWGGGYGAWRVPIFRRLILKGQHADFVRADSHAASTVEKVKRLLGDGQIDVLFIDGDHSYEGCKHDFESYSALVRPGGMVLFHDIAKHPPKDDCHVDRVWAELRQKYESREFIADPTQGWAGIGLLRLPS